MNALKVSVTVRLRTKSSKTNTTPAIAMGTIRNKYIDIWTLLTVRETKYVPHLESAPLTPFLACRLIPLDKCPSVRPIGIGDVPRRIVSKVVLYAIGDDIVQLLVHYRLAQAVRLVLRLLFMQWRNCLGWSCSSCWHFQLYQPSSNTS